MEGMGPKAAAERRRGLGAVPRCGDQASAPDGRNSIPSHSSWLLDCLTDYLTASSRASRHEPARLLSRPGLLAEILLSHPSSLARPLL